MGFIDDPIIDDRIVWCPDADTLWKEFDALDETTGHSLGLEPKIEIIEVVTNISTKSIVN